MYLNDIIANEIPFEFKFRIENIFEISDYSQFSIIYENYKN